MWVELGAAAFLIGQYLYHRYTGDEDVHEHASFKIPAVDDGGVVGLVYGRCRVKNLIPAWISTPASTDDGDFNCNILYIAGIPFSGGTSDIHGMWLGDAKFAWSQTSTYTNPPYAEDVVPRYAGKYIIATKSFDVGHAAGPHIEFLDGNSSQELVNDAGEPVTWAGHFMMDEVLLGFDTILSSTKVAPAEQISGYRGYLSILLHNGGAASPGGPTAQWSHGINATLPNYSAEVSSYPPGSYPWGLQIGQDCNPIDVVYDLLTAKFGKLGMDASTFVDMSSFTAAAGKLHTESHGYSRAMEEAKTGDEWIMDILKQIDGAMYEDPSTGLLKIKLIRDDYDPATIPVIDRSNCSGLTNFAAGGWTGIINKLRLVYTNRDDDYREASVTIQNMANAVGQDGIVREQVIRMLGCTNQWLAWRLAERELAARSRPITKLRAIVDRSLIRLNQGDAVKLNWTDPDIGGMIFRVANVSHGVINDGKVALDLIQDYFYTYRGSYPTGGGTGGFGSTLDRDIRPVDLML